MKETSKIKGKIKGSWTTDSENDYRSIMMIDDWNLYIFNTKTGEIETHFD